VTAPIEVRVLGPLEVLRDGSRLPLTSNRLRALLAALATSAGGVVSAETLGTAVWGRALPASPRSSLQTYVARLRRLLGDEAIVTRPGGYQLQLEADQVDARRFLRLAGAPRGAAYERDNLVEALTLWRGVPYEGIESEWLAESESDRLTEAYLDALERAADLDLVAGRAVDLLDRLRAASERHPLREPLCARLMLALDATGRRAEALALYEAFRARLADELGTDPGPRLREAHGRLVGGGSDEVPRQLPSDIARFTGRSDVLEALDQLTTVGPAVGVLHGTGGVGKTAAVVHWAHRVGSLFPDGQLFVNLHGYAPGQPVPPSVALDGLLRALGVEGRKIPDKVRPRTAMLRKLLAGRRTLLVLDNARDVEQVRPLLPGGRNLAVVTSRNRLRELEHPQVRRIHVGELSRGEAMELLVTALRDENPEQEVEDLEGLIDLCGRLPLALAVAAEQAGRHPQHELRRLVTELRDRHDRLDALEVAGDPSSSVRTVFSWSLGTLPPDCVRGFELLGLHPGPDFGAPAAAAVIGTPSERILGRLVDAHLLEQRRPGRYQFHDLLRAYAAERAADLEPAEREAALTRMFGWHVHSTASARIAIGRGESLGETGPLPAGVTPQEFADETEAFGWFDTERAVLVAMVDVADALSDPAAHRIAEQMSSYLIVRYVIGELLRTQQIALDVARRTGDERAEAVATGKLGSVYRMHGDNELSRDMHRDALAQFEKLGDDRGRAVAMANLGTVLQALGDDLGALDCHEQGLAVAREVGDSDQVALLLNNMSISFLRTGRSAEAIAACREALALPRSRTFQHGTAHMWDSLGQALSANGDYDEAIEAYQTSLAEVRTLGDPWGEAIVLSNLGNALREAARPDEAVESWRHALSVMEDNAIADSHEVSRTDLMTRIESLS
jgi:DNA-binding SARP family transcriptional activator